MVLARSRHSGVRLSVFNTLDFQIMVHIRLLVDLVPIKPWNHYPYKHVMCPIGYRARAESLAQIQPRTVTRVVANDVHSVGGHIQVLLVD